MNNYFSFDDNDMHVHYSRSEHPLSSKFKMHTHEFYELYYFQEGNAIYRIEGTPYQLKTGDILIIRPTESHYVDILSDTPYTRLSIHFNPELFSTIDPNSELLKAYNNRQIGTHNLYRSENFKTDSFDIYIKNIINTNKKSKLNLTVNLLQILNEISMAFESLDENEGSKTLDKRIIDYINRHITENISLDEICKRYSISKTHLCRIFKKATASTIGEYITTKRLLNAKQLINSGIPPTKAYLDCGFKDYSVFYRAYRKNFNISPNEQKTVTFK